MRLIREGHKKSYLIIWKNSEPQEISKIKLHRLLKVNGLIRLEAEDFAFFKKRNNFVTHFNLQSSDHRKGKDYALVKIRKHGYYLGKGKEQLPLLDLRQYLAARCLKVKNNVPYEKLARADFKYSIPGIKNIAALKKAIYRRYHKSLPKLTQAKMISLGVAITNLKLIHK